LGSDAPRTYTGPTDPKINWLVKEVHDETHDITLSIQFICGCGERVVDLGNEEFECLHCDRFCDIQDCIHCEELEKSDVEAYLSEMEDGDEDSDI